MRLADCFEGFYKDEVILIDHGKEIMQIRADMQLRGGSLENNPYGFYQNEKVRMFCDSNDRVVPGMRVKYKDKLYITESVADGDWGMIVDLRRCGGCES